MQNCNFGISDLRPEDAIDGLNSCSDGSSVFFRCYEDDGGVGPSWQVELASKSMIHSIVVHKQHVSDYYMSDLRLQIYDGSQLQKEILLDRDLLTWSEGVWSVEYALRIVGDRVQLVRGDPNHYLSVCEVEVNGIPLDECSTQTYSQYIDGIHSQVLDGEDYQYILI